MTVGWFDTVGPWLGSGDTDGRGETLGDWDGSGETLGLLLMDGESVFPHPLMKGLWKQSILSRSNGPKLNRSSVGPGDLDGSGLLVGELVGPGLTVGCSISGFLILVSPDGSQLTLGSSVRVGLSVGPSSR